MREAMLAAEQAAHKSWDDKHASEGEVGGSIGGLHRALDVADALDTKVVTICHLDAHVGLGMGDAR